MSLGARERWRWGQGGVGLGRTRSGGRSGAKGKEAQADGTRAVALPRIVRVYGDVRGGGVALPQSEAAVVDHPTNGEAECGIRIGNMVGIPGFGILITVQHRTPLQTAGMQSVFDGVFAATEVFLTSYSPLTSAEGSKGRRYSGATGISATSSPSGAGGSSAKRR